MKHALIAILLAGLCATHVGCVSLNKPFPQKSVYAIELPTPQAKDTPKFDAVLRLRRVKVSDPYDQRAMVWRQAGDTYVTDFYNVLLASPGTLLTGEAQRYLGTAGPFTAVVDSASGADAGFVLETQVTRFYGDETDVAKPTAVIEASFYLVDEREGNAALLAHEAYAEAAPLDEVAPGALAEGWAVAWEAILTRLAADLAAYAKDQAANPSP